jgi:hypothetical protein
VFGKIFDRERNFAITHQSEDGIDYRNATACAPRVASVNR